MCTSLSPQQKRSAMAERGRPELETSFTDPLVPVESRGEEVFTLLTEEMAGPQPQPDSRTIVNGEFV